MPPQKTGTASEKFGAAALSCAAPELRPCLMALLVYVYLLSPGAMMDVLYVMTSFSYDVIGYSYYDYVSGICWCFKFNFIDRFTLRR